VAGQDLEPELLPNGDILAPITQADGSQRTVRLDAGTDEHAAWLARIQQQRKHRGRAPAELFHDPLKPPPPPPPPPAPATATISIPWGKVIATIAAILVVVWFTGALDKPLSGIGLNKNPCIVTAVGGSTLCGDEAKAWCDSTDRFRRLAPSVSSDSQATCDEIRGQ
jgi:hypothetical protein